MHRVPSSPGTLSVVTIEHFQAFDHTEGTARIWRISDGNLIPLAKAFEELVDYYVAESPSGLVIDYTRVPVHLDPSIMGVRLAYRLTITADAKRPYHYWVRGVPGEEVAAVENVSVCGCGRAGSAAARCSGAAQS